MVMETYYRKHPKKTNQQPTVSCQKEAEQVSIAAAEPPGLGRLPPPPLSSDHRALLLKEPQVDGDKQSHIKPGYLYEIDHKHLPPRTPVQLRSIRVAMVCEKTEMNVAVRFPSKESLRAFFIYSARETHPALDEKFVMGIALADKVLVKLVEAEIFSEQKSLETFWMIDSSADEYLYKDNNNNNNISVTYKKGANNGLSDALKRNGMVRWGIRRQVKYLGRHKEIEHGVSDVVNGQNSSPSFIDGIEGSQMELEAVCDERESMEEEKNGARDEDKEENDDDDDDDGDDEEEEEEINGDDQEHEDEEEEEEEDKIKRGSNKNLKRKRYSFRNIAVKKHKRENIEIKKQRNKKSGNKKSKVRVRFKEALVLRDPKDRWSAERYKMAEQNLLSVMKSQGATAEKPIMRPQLRAEARKKIGDTGLLDHLLKHMAGKVAPGGEKRFRRRHNPDGAMEYWLESADLVNIRRDAGVTDPYWVPPRGWKPGDSPTQDPICARELKLLKDGINKMERDFMATKMQLEDEVGKLRRELNELSASEKSRQEEENQAITIVSSRSDISQRLDQLATSLESSKCDLGRAHNPVEKYKEQWMAISDFVKEMEEKLGKSTANNIVQETPRKEEPLLIMVPRDTNTKEKNSKQQPEALIAASSNTGKTSPETVKKIENYKDPLIVAAEKEKEKAAKIQRMKSGFRICKPQGTFLWPNMVKDNYININSTSGSNQVMVQVEVPTPPSVNSSTAALAHQLLVKPLAEKPAVKVTVSTNYHQDDGGANNYYSSNSAAPLINLNNAPPKLNPNMPLTEVSANASTSPWENGAYYGTRNVIMGLRGGYDTKENNDNNNNNASCCCSSLPCEVGNNWLALSTLTSASDDSATHG